ncbi:Glyoxalase/Bleomycin resistance protein/Dihydroxybiphenyl dioxygenase [Ochromonadaceae sp. CCMP2298]|nr:Glyoxalase/Bleomycin resistance protein/Dihydroxybiphenyl dioxygenase [Ochromonadaceae sp. CCMP2298]
MCSIGLVNLLVRDYDEARDFYTQKMGFKLVEEKDFGGGKRWIVVSPPGAPENSTGLLLAKASQPEEEAAVGNQSGGRVFMFLNTDDFARDYGSMKANGVEFLEEPRYEVYGDVVVLRDLYGNKFDLIQRKT